MGIDRGGTMKVIFLLALVLFLTYAGYRYMRPQPDVNPGYVPTTNAASEKAVVAAAPMQKNICQKCKGEGYYMTKGVRPGEDKRHICVVCLGQGFKLLPPDVKACPSCAGMGRVVDTTPVKGCDTRRDSENNPNVRLQSVEKPIIGTLCRRCMGTGIIK